MTSTHTLPPPETLSPADRIALIDSYDALPPPPKRCPTCDAPVGDGDWATGKRQCALHRKRRYTPPRPRGY